MAPTLDSMLAKTKKINESNYKNVNKKKIIEIDRKAYQSFTTNYD